MKIIALILLLFSTVLADSAELIGKSDALITALTKATASPNPHVRAIAARELAEIGGPAARDRLIDMLQDQDPIVSAAAAESLGKDGDQTASTFLINLLAHEDISASTNTDSLLIKDSPSTIQHFTEMQAEERQVVTIKALSRMNNPQAGDAIISHGLESQQIGVRIAAAIALGRLKHQAAVKPLLAILEVYYQAGHTESGPVFDSGTKDDRHSIKDNNAYLRSAVVWALGEIRNPIAKPVLTKALEDDNSNVRDSVREALDKL